MHAVDIGDAGEIAARSTETGDETCPTGSMTCDEDDRNRRGCRLAAMLRGRLPVVTITCERRATKIGCKCAQSIVSPSAQRNSIATFRPSHEARFVSSPARNAATEVRFGSYWRSMMHAEVSDHRHRGCCARATSGHAAALPSPAMNARRCSGRDVRFIARPPPRSVRAAFPHTAPTSGV